MLIEPEIPRKLTVGIKEKRSLHGSRSNAQLQETSNVEGNGNGATEPAKDRDSSCVLAS